MGEANPGTEGEAGQAAAQPQAAAAATTAAATTTAAAAAEGNAYQNASLYIGDLHPDVTEALLFDIFNSVGPVASIRVCRDAVTRRSLGYAYVNFHHMQDAERALDTMNYTPIKDRPCRMMWSQRDPSLRKTGAGNVFVKNLDLSIDNKALYDTFSLFGNILSCKVVTDKEGNSQGHGFVHFETMEAAEEAIRKINGMLIAGKAVFVGNFVKRTERAGGTEWTNLYVKNIPKHWSEARLQDLFETCGSIASLTIMKDGEGKSKGFGFVDYTEHKGAVAAIEKLHKMELAADEESEKIPKDDNSTSVEVGEKHADIEGNSASKDDKENDEKKEENKEAEEAGAAEVVKKPLRRTTSLFVGRAQKKAERDRELSEKFEQMKMERQNKYQGVNLYVKNLDEKVTDEILHKEFSKFGSITSVRVMREQVDASEGDEEEVDENGVKKKRLGVSKGFGFVCFSTSEEAMKAVTEMHGSMILSKPIFVTLAQRKESRRAQLEAQHTRRMPRGIPMQPGMYPGPMYMGGGMPGAVPGAVPGAMPMAPGAMPPQARGNYGYMPGLQMMMPRGMPARGMPAYPMQGMPGQPGFVGQPMPGGVPGQPQGQMAGMPAGAGGRGRGRAKGGVPPQQQQQQQGQFKYNSNVRNQPGMQQQMPMNMQQPMMQQQIPPVQPEPLTAAALASASEQEQKNMIGERLYPLIHRVEAKLAGKITGMLLEMDNPELLHLLESPQALQDKIREAITVLQQHAQQG